MCRFLLTLALAAVSLPVHATRQDNPFFDLSGDFSGRIVIEVATREAVSVPARLSLQLGGRKKLMDMELSVHAGVILTPVSNPGFPVPLYLDWRFVQKKSAVTFGNTTVGDYSGIYHLGKQGFQFAVSQSSASYGELGPGTPQWARPPCNGTTIGNTSCST